MWNSKPIIPLVAFGHEKAGISTLLGQFIYMCGGIDKRTIDKFARETAEKRVSDIIYLFCVRKIIINPCFSVKEGH